MDDLYPLLFTFLFFHHKVNVYIFDVFFPEYLKLDKNNDNDILLYQNKV